MRLCRFSNAGTESYGILEKDRVVDLVLLAKRLQQPLPSSIDALARSEHSKFYLDHLLRKSTRADIQEASSPTTKMRLHHPIRKPSKIICLGLNYKDHAAEQGATPPEEPVIFMKPRTTLIGPRDSIVKPRFVKQLDYEAELAIVMGKRAKNVSVDEAEARIFGYTILNDVSARDIQFKDRQWTRGKSFDTFAPMGPCITLVDQIGDPTNLRVRTWVNKKIRQDSTTRNMVFDVFQIVQSLSCVMTLEPCDVISTGTPAGVGFAMKPEPQFLENGDNVAIEVENIGVLRNNVVEEKLIARGLTY